MNFDDLVKRHGFATVPINRKTYVPLCGFKNEPPGTQLHREGQPYAIITGSKSKNLVVVDIDCKGGKDGFQTLENLERDYGALPPTLSVDTRSGGMHLYYWCSAGVRNSASELGEGVDVRGENGLVFADPLKYRICEDVPIVELPAAWVALLGAPRGNELRGAADVRPAEAVSEFTRDDLRAELKGCKGAYAEAWRAVVRGERFIKVRGGTKGPDRGPVDSFLAGMCGWLVERGDWSTLSYDAFKTITAASWSLVQMDDREAGNPTYGDDDLWVKFDRFAEGPRRLVESAREIRDAFSAGKVEWEASEGDEGPAVAQIQNRYYLRETPSFWSGPFVASELYGHVRQAGKLPCEMPTKAGSRPMTAAELMRAYGLGGSLKEVCFDYREERCGLNTPTLTIHAGRPVYDEPVRSFFVENILNAMDGGEGRLIDWLAWVMDRDENAPALWLKGPPGVGKSEFLAQGLASIWGAYVDARGVIGDGQETRFQVPRLGSPLIIADEYIPEKGHKPDIQGLKRIITERSFTIEHKGGTHDSLKGSARVLMLSNNNLSFERATGVVRDDVRALLERVISIDMAPWANEVKQSFTCAPRGLIESGEFARHILWMNKELRKPRYRGRLCLPAHDGVGLSHELAKTDGGYVILEAVVKDTQRNDPKGILFEGKGWGYTTAQIKGMTLGALHGTQGQRIAGTLRKICGDKVRVRKGEHHGRYWVFPPDVLTRFAEEND